MERLNYQHLFYFWNVAKEGGIMQACEKLHLAQPTISAQLTVFEKAIGGKLFYKNGRKLVLTDSGQIVFQYAEEIFTLGRELTNTLKGRTGSHAIRLNVGVADALPKLVAYRLLEPILNSKDTVQLVCFVDKAEKLIAEIAFHGVDLVLSDSPAFQAAEANVFNHLLGESAIAVFGTPKLFDRYRVDFPRSLNGAPLILPTSNTALRRSLDQWFDAREIYPKVQAEIEDSALLKTFASAGAGMFFAPVAVADEINYQYGARIVGHIDNVFERFYAITARRKLKHPAVVTILEEAPNRLFSLLNTS
ncbi:MAG: transcriptional activator NhaR [Methylomonas sp.]|jgi:LysR family transcriptional activator of nhaA